MQTVAVLLGIDADVQDNDGMFSEHRYPVRPESAIALALVLGSQQQDKRESWQQNVKTPMILISKTTSLYMHHTSFFTSSSPSLHNLNHGVKFLYVTSYDDCKHKTMGQIP